MIAAPCSVRGPGRRWLSVVLVLMLFAAAGVPASLGGTFAEQRHELGAEAASRADAAHETLLPAASASYLHRTAHAGRPAVSWRGLTVRGLPPARAPTA